MDGTFERFTGGDSEAVRRAYFARLATKATDSVARKVLLDMSAGAVPMARACGRRG
jgi:hypothetical protein